MVAYGIEIIPMIKQMKAQFPDVTQTWYANHAGAIGTFSNVDLYFNFLKRFVPGCGHYPEPPKSVMIVHRDNLDARKRFGLRHEFKLYTGAYYLGGFIWGNEFKRDWLKVCTKTWEQNITKIRSNAGKYPQESYAVLVRLIQLEWIFLQRITINMGESFAGV